MTLPVPDFSNTKVLVIGDVMLDRYWGGATSRISPEAPVQVVKVSEEDDRLGGAANVAKNLHELGCSASLRGIIGEDSAGECLRALLREFHIDDLLEVNPSAPTITKLRVISRQQQLLRMDFEEDHSLGATKLLNDHTAKAIHAADVLILSDYAKGGLDKTQELIATAEMSGTPVLVDPKGGDFSRYQGATLITPNRAEFERIVGECRDDAMLEQQALRLISELNINAILVTLSERGMALFQQGEPGHFIPALAREVYDVTGAGDTVIATCAAALAAGTNLLDAVKLANYAASIVVGKLGTAGVSRDELQQAIALAHVELDAGVVNETDLLERITLCRHRGETIVLTNGCFDLLHPGHVRYLNKASTLGDRLVVAVNSDASVRRLKGEERPINQQQDRMLMLAALKSVDWVVCFEEDTPQRIISEIVPDILVKGGDYQAEDIVGYQEVTAAGGQVVIAAFEEGHSSTATIEKIKALQTKAD